MPEQKNNTNENTAPGNGPIISKAPTVKQPTLGKKICDLLFEVPDGRTVKEWFIKEKLVPGIKFAVVDIVTMIFTGSGAKKTNYNTVSSPISKVSYESGRQSHNNYSVKTSTDNLATVVPFVFDAQADAITILSALRDMINLTGDCSVRDYYDKIGYTDSKNPIDTIYGWNDLSTAHVRRVSTGNGMQWEINFPSLVKIK